MQCDNLSATLPSKDSSRCTSEIAYYLRTVFLQALHCVPFFGIGSDCGMLPGYKIDSLEPQPYVHDRVRGFQELWASGRSGWKRETLIKTRRRLGGILWCRPKPNPRKR